MKIDFARMCDRCFRTLGDNEKMVAFKLVDDLEQEMLIKGHEECIEQTIDVIKQIYGKKEENNE
jgi:hypothetical protein